jgi:hypothetical protein
LQPVRHWYLQRGVIPRSADSTVHRLQILPSYNSDSRKWNINFSKTIFVTDSWPVKFSDAFSELFYSSSVIIRKTQNTGAVQSIDNGVKTRLDG